MMGFLRCALLALSTIGYSAVLAATALAADEAKIEFNRDVRPILSSKCFRCHGQEEASREGGFHLTERESAIGEADSSEIPIVPGDSEASELIRRLTTDDDSERMPPPETKMPAVTPEEIAVLQRWIDQGAEFQKHWSLIAPERPEAPEVQNKTWSKNPVDHFTLSKLEQEGLKPSLTADRHTLIRRVTFDLTGLPPTPQEVDAFVNNPAPLDEIYPQLVDRLLASKSYGEHQARFWLDAARYGDTHGLHLDNYREMWPYRDEVIHAFNNNMPWDVFTTKNMAGDLLPDATLEDQVLSGFNRLHVTTNEGGSIPQEVYVRNVIDRVSTTSTVFLGLTAECAVCHDHKFDPITAKEFYSLFAFFNNLDANPMDGNKKAHAPTIRVYQPDQKAQLAIQKKAIADADAKAQELLATVLYEEPNLPASERKTFVWIDDTIPEGTNAKDGGAGKVWNWVEKPDHPVHTGLRSLRVEGRGMVNAHNFNRVAQPLRVGIGDKLFTHVYVDPANPPRAIMLQWHTNGWKHRAYWGENLLRYGRDNSTERYRGGDLPSAGQWVRLEVDAATVGIYPGDVITGWAFTQHDGTVYWDASGIDSSVSQEPEDVVWIDDHAPENARLAGDSPTWQWVTAEGGQHPVHTGEKSLRRSGGDRLNQDYFTGAKPLRLQNGDKLFAYVYLDPDNPPKSVQLQFNNGNWEHRVRWGAPAHGANRGGGADFVASEQIPETGKWVRLEVPIESVGLRAGAAINGWAFTQVGGTVYWDTAGVHTLKTQDDQRQYSLALWTQTAKHDQKLPADVRQAATGAPEGRTKAQKQRLHDYYVRYVWAGSRNEFNPLNAQVSAAQTKIAAIDKAAPTTLVMKERAKPRPAYVLKRGQYDLPDKEQGALSRVVPAALPSLPEGAPANRLGFAQWLVAPSHPLMARVTVNRFWQQCFGTGIVKTTGDFGSQGEWPSHPELLDWLAVEFRESGWDVKQLLKTIVTSATYMQDSRMTPELVKRDPANRLLAHGPRFRLDAEMLRDQALAVSGLLASKIGGPGVRPPQPLGIWKAVGFTSSNTANFKADKGPDKVHRRSIYTFWKRTAPPPQMSTLDAPSRESCTVRRERTNTPLQALLLLNDPQYVEAARGLAQRSIQEGGSSPEARATWMFKLATARAPGADELSELVAVYRDRYTHYQSHEADAVALTNIGDAQPEASLDRVELAAWTLVANVILNLDEVVTKE